MNYEELTEVFIEPEISNDYIENYNEITKIYEQFY